MPNSTVLSASAIGGYALAAGFPQSEIPLAVAVAMAESGGNPNATNSAGNSAGVDKGLWQINDYWNKDVIATGDPFDPATNAKMAYKIWTRNGKTWKPWSAYNNGSYKKHLDATLKTELPTELNPSSPTGLPTMPDFASLAQTMNRITSNLLSVLIGVAFIALGIYVIVSQTDAAKKLGGVVLSAAKAATPAGRVIGTAETVAGSAK